ncbi:efflux RND transporter permease subunit [Magnetospira thiophila]
MSPVLHPDHGGGLIRLFTRHPTAANLLMVAMLIGGAFGLYKINTQFFPDTGIDQVQITVNWPGASAEDVDSTIVQAIEPEVRFLDGVDKVRSSSVEGRASIAVEFVPGSDMQSALSNVETALGQVTTLPEDAETPEIRRVVRYDTISRMVISGPYSEAALKVYAKRIRDDLLNRGVDKVDMFGARDEEIWVEISEADLRRLDLTLSDIGERIAQTSRDLPSGSTQGGAERQIRSLGQVKTAQGMKTVEVLATNDGQKIYLGDIARVREDFDEAAPVALFKGQPAIELHIQRSNTADALKVADRVEAYLAEVLPTLPSNLSVTQYTVESDLIRSRIDLLLNNGASGLILVLAVLFAFLNARVAFWVAVGIPVSLAATLLVMLASGQSINMISLFGLIMAIGIVVDDAIVVGEHGEFLRRRGMAALEAAEMGASRMAVPVMASSLTTIAAFMPLFVVGDIIGQMIVAIPLVIVAVILASVVECFFVMPGHMRHALRASHEDRGRFRQAFDGAFDRFRQGPFTRLVHFCLEWRYATLATTLALFILCIGMVAGGRVGFQFFKGPEADRLYGNVQMVAGTSRAETARMVNEVERALRTVEDRLTEGRGGLVVAYIVKLGTGVGRGDPRSNPASGDNQGGLYVELTEGDKRDIRTSTIMEAWAAEARKLPGLDSLSIVPAQVGPPGRDVDIRVVGNDLEALKTTTGAVIELLRQYPGVSAPDDDLPWGKQEAVLELTPRGRALGFTTESVGRQVRNAFEGAIAQRFARGDEEVVVRVRHPRADTGYGHLRDLYLTAANGTEVPLDSIVSWREKDGFASIRRENGVREAAVVAEINKDITATDKVIEALERDGIHQLAAAQGVSIRFAGKAEEQARTFGDMRVGAMIGLSAIYIILAWVFGSYSRPIVVMSVIPLGFVGATLGHWLLGYDLTILSMVALIGLSGIVVNDSIILVSTIAEYQERGEDTMEAILDGARDRLRAVILTSATTVGGLTPLLFETSLQAKFLIPMAVTIVFGLMVATLLVLVVVPCLLAVLNDFGHLRQRVFGARVAAAE